MGTTEIILLTMIISGSAAFLIGRNIAKALPDDKAKIYGGVAVLAGFFLVVYGISSMNSVASQMRGMIGQVDAGGLIAIGLGVFTAVVGIIIIVTKSGQTIKSSSTTKKCPFCAEPIQMEATLCRYCGKEIGI